MPETDRLDAHRRDDRPGPVPARVAVLDEGLPVATVRELASVINADHSPEITLREPVYREPPRRASLRTAEKTWRSQRPSGGDSSGVRTTDLYRP